MSKNPLALPALGLCLLAAFGCDDSANRKAGVAPSVPSSAQAPAKKADQAPESKDAKPEAAVPAPAKPTDPAGVVKAYSSCYTACFSEKGPATNRETCKLNCDAAAEANIEGVTNAPPKDDFMKNLSTFHGCVNACYEDKSLNSTNRETCILTCQDAAEVAATAK